MIAAARLGIETLVAALIVAGIPAGPAPDPVTCAGYPEPRVFIESQDWWDPIPELGGLGHIHSGACWPLAQTLTGMVHVDLRVVFHNNHGTLLRVTVEDVGPDTQLLRINVNYTPPSGQDSTLWVPLDFDSRGMLDGQRLLRIHTVLEHANGNLEDARPVIPVIVDNGKRDANMSKYKWINPSAWYKEIEPSPDVDWGYLGPQMSLATFPTAPVSGVWSPRLKAVLNGKTSGAPAISRSEVFIDPDFHNGSEGIVVSRTSGALDGTLPIDTVALGLTNGLHRLVFVVTQDGPAGERHSAVGSYPFTVNNAEAVP